MPSDRPGYLGGRCGFFRSGLNLSILNKISLALDDLMLPYTFDLSLYYQIKEADLIDNIQRVGKVFYSKDHRS